jgi:hypothetical protein
MERRRIPKTIPGFNIHIGVVSTFLQKTEAGATVTNGERLGMLPAELVIMNNFSLAWSNPGATPKGAYDLHSNPLTKTEVTRLDVLKIMKDFSVFFRQILVRMSGSPNITAEDRAILRIAEPSTTRTRPTAVIAESCFASPVVLGGGSIKLVCRHEHDSNRASKPTRADAVEIAYRIDRVLYNSQTGEILPLHVIESPDDGTTKLLSTKAIFRLSLGIEHAGSKLQLYARWINTKHPELAGPWKGPFTSFIG